MKKASAPKHASKTPKQKTIQSVGVGLGAGVSTKVILRRDGKIVSNGK